MRGRKAIPPTPHGPFSVPQAAKLAGLPYDVVSYWARTGLVSPSARTPRGRGYWRQFGFTDLVALKVGAALRGKGVSTQALRRVIDELPRDTLVHPLAQHRLIVWGRDVLLVEGDFHWSVLKNPRQGVIPEVVLLEPLVRQLRADVANAARKKRAVA